MTGTLARSARLRPCTTRPQRPWCHAHENRSPNCLTASSWWSRAWCLRHSGGRAVSTTPAVARAGRMRGWGGSLKSACRAICSRPSLAAASSQLLLGTESMPRQRSVRAMTWKVWAENDDLLFEGSEAEAREYVAEHPDSSQVVLESPDGDSYRYQDS